MNRRPEKYSSSVRYAAAWANRLALRSVLRAAYRWRPLEQPQEGYSIIVGVPWKLWDLVQIPLLSLQRARHLSCTEVIVAVDTTESRLLDRYGMDAVQRIVERFCDLRPRVLFYGAWQHALSRTVNWNWVDCWLTWVMGLGRTRTRYALLHDFDAVVVDVDFIERHYELARRGSAVYTGIDRDPDWCAEGRDVLMTIELMVDVEHLRRRYAPVDLFNRVRRHEGRRMECDILRDVQLRENGRSAVVHELAARQVVHPSQVVSQWHKLTSSRLPYAPRGYTPLLVLPYFRYVGGDSAPMMRAMEALKITRLAMPVEGHTLDLRQLDRKGVDWAAEQIERLELYFSDRLDPRVEEYCRQIRSIVSP